MASVQQQKFYNNILHRLYKKSKKIKIDDSDKIIILSDLHLGNGKKIEDLQKFNQKTIEKARRTIRLIEKELKLIDHSNK